MFTNGSRVCSCKSRFFSQSVWECPHEAFIKVTLARFSKYIAIACTWAMSVYAYLHILSFHHLFKLINSSAAVYADGHFERRWQVAMVMRRIGRSCAMSKSTQWQRCFIPVCLSRFRTVLCRQTHKPKELCSFLEHDWPAHLLETQCSSASYEKYSETSHNSFRCCLPLVWIPFHKAIWHIKRERERERTLGPTCADGFIPTPLSVTLTTANSGIQAIGQFEAWLAAHF